MKAHIINRLWLATTAAAIVIAAIMPIGTKTAAATPSTDVATSVAGNQSKQVAFGAGSARLETQRRELARQASVPVQTIDCWENVWLFADANDRFVSAELSYPGPDFAMLRARATVVGPWELFDLCRERETGRTLMYSDANLLYVTAELGSTYTGNRASMLRARADVVGSWQQFTTTAGPGGNYVCIRSLANSRYVSAETGLVGNYYGMLRARHTACSTLQTFFW
jgi:hypothetical protein